jgi:hypothetical protein
MVCPVCVTTAIVANAPVICAAVGGLAAVKVSVAARQPKPQCVKLAAKEAAAKGKQLQLDPFKVMVARSLDDY